MKQEGSSETLPNELPSVADSLTSHVNEADASKVVEASPGSTATPQSQSANPQQPPMMASQSGQATVQQATTVTQVHTPSIADDEDLIEKEWVESAKRIMSQTKGDPHAQSESITEVKKDYKKKRFNIDNELGKVG